VHLIALVLSFGNDRLSSWCSLLRLSSFLKFAIQPCNSRHNEVDIFYQGRTCMEHFEVLRIPNSCREREKTRTNTKHSKWLAKVMWIKLSNGPHHSLRVYTQFHSCFTLKVYSLALKFLFNSSKNLQSTHQEFNIKVKDVTDLSSTQEANERKTPRENQGTLKTN